MKTDDEIEALEKQVAELKAECFRWAERWETHITGAFRAMEERAEAAEAKLREAELGAYARRADIIALRDLAEKAEREMSAILDTLPADVVVRVREGAGPESVAASLAVSVAKMRGRMEKAERERDDARERLEGASILWHREKHAGLWEDCKRDICVADRDALGEEP